MTENLSGIINIYKPKGMTSHGVVSKLRKILNMRKIGHTGTLDPDAVGVLPICVGKATKAADMLTAKDKQYLAEVTLGSQTDTQDSSGKVLNTADVDVTENDITAAIESFVGEIEQVPPMYSAIKVGGKKLYELARENKTIERKPRKIFIENIKLIDFDGDTKFTMLVDCSKGTYIRTLSNDIGEKLGCYGHMSSLTRTRSGMFKIENAYTLEKIEEMYAKNNTDFLIRVDEVFGDFEKIVLNEKATNMVKNGVKVRAPKTAVDDNVYRVYDSENNFLTLSKCEENRLKILKTFF